MNSKPLLTLAVPLSLVLGLLGVFPAAVALAGETELVTEEGVIAGEMTIDFQTRVLRDATGKLAEGSPAQSAKDIYTFTLDVAKTTEFAGTITRLPRLFSRVLGREMQAAELYYD
ncbi:MAG TPA: hypothetical protein PLX83_21120, partial [bacterium]|nr:hypothetical protein [bacterium]